jgi:hypothetical protein
VSNAVKLFILLILAGMAGAYLLGRGVRTDHDLIRRERDSLVAVVPAILRRDTIRIQALEDSLNSIRSEVDTIKVIEYFNSRTTADSLRRLLRESTSLRDSVNALVAIIKADSISLSKADNLVQNTGKLLAIAEGALAVNRAQLALNQTLYNSLKSTQELDCYILDQKWIGRCPSHTVTFFVGAAAGVTAALIVK